eukprot:c3973_g1_i1.p1 GENE.c3973_g1_i1~~c3973_g1_i1.p1  ORF type:complete len:594 (+),score=163.66 c3973_g1_i1:45-1826(+)
MIQRLSLLSLLSAFFSCSLALRVLRHDTTHFGPARPTPGHLAEFMNSHLREEIKPTDEMSTTMYKIAGAASDFAKDVLASMEEVDGIDTSSILRGNNNIKGQKLKKPEADDYPYWRFIPELTGKVIPDGPAIKWDGLCYTGSSAKAVNTNSTTVTITLTLGKAKSLVCSDTFLISDVTQFGLHTYTTHGEKQIVWTLSSNLTSSDLWDLHTNGIRVFMFLDPLEELMKSITETALLFEPIATKAVSSSAASRNLDFLSKYASIHMTKRNITDVALNASEINSGDFFGVLRLDGLDPMLGWAMGSTTGHTTVALRDSETGILYVCESTATSSYWDVNGIQCTEYEQWIAKAKAASYHVVHLPLAPKYRSAFNEANAWDFVRSVEGFDYGYYTLLYGWVDTVADNYPCIPPTYTRCLTYEIVEILFPIGSMFVPAFKMLWEQAWNFRVQSRGLSFSAMLQKAANDGIVANTIPTIVEQDSWMYNTTRNGQPAVGPSMVCCVFVCNVWKHSGMFGDLAEQINCGELTNWDDYSMLVFDPDYVRPQACVDADPDNNVCQLLGDYTLLVNNYNSKAPFPHIAEKCPSLPPNYDKPADC